MARKIIGIKVCYYLIKIFLHNKIHFKMKSTKVQTLGGIWRMVY